MALALFSHDEVEIGVGREIRREIGRETTASRYVEM
jgi:hypothetical protein